MTTLYADNFTDIVTSSFTSPAQDGWSATPSSQTPFRTSSAVQRRTGVNSASMEYNRQGQRNITTSSSTVFMSFAVNCTTLPASGNPQYLTEIRDSGDLLIARVSQTSANQWRIQYGVSGTAVVSTATFSLSTWYWVQLKVVIHDTTGSIELRDSSGNVLCSATNVDTKPGTPNTPGRIRVGSGSDWSPGSAYLTDLHVWDDTGSICNTWTNPSQVDTFLPNGAGSSAQFTPSAGANWQCVDEAQATSAEFVSTAGENTGYKDLYTFANLSAVPDAIYSVFVTAQVNKDNAGPGKLKLDVLSGATAASSAVQTPAESGDTRVAAVFEADPATSAAWDQTGFNAAEFGFEVSA
ncbi:MAG: hypothetical protein ACOYBW_08720 [Fluviibacter phosphoraccumulans]